MASPVARRTDAENLATPEDALAAVSDELRGALGQDEGKRVLRLIRVQFSPTRDWRRALRDLSRAAEKALPALRALQATAEPINELARVENGLRPDLRTMWLSLALTARALHSGAIGLIDDAGRVANAMEPLPRVGSEEDVLRTAVCKRLRGLVEAHARLAAAMRPGLLMLLAVAFEVEPPLARGPQRTKLYKARSDGWEVAWKRYGAASDNRAP